MSDSAMSKFYTLTELKAFFETDAVNASPSDFIRNPKYKHLKEMWCAIQFGVGYEKYVATCCIQVNKEENSDVDFILRTKAGQFPFQSTIADVPGRRMGDEYKMTPNGSMSSKPSVLGGRIEGAKWIADAVRAKDEKKYSHSRKLNLLVYANFMSFSLQYQSLSEELQPYTERFSSIWVITNQQICSVYSMPLLGAIQFLGNL